MSALEQGVLRWGVVGTGSIAQAMAPQIADAGGCVLAAVSSRHLASAQAFAGKHGIPSVFGSWLEMAQSDLVDALYIATPTGVKEEICLAAAAQGKHVLAEKPFESLASLKRITGACRERGLVFMDGTHFVHHPRTHLVKNSRDDRLGWPCCVASAFAFHLPDRANIRYSTGLEPMGAIGDAGWYNMRAAVEFLSPGVEPVAVSAFVRRDDKTGAAIGGSGVIRFDDDSMTTWNCGFDCGATIMDLRIMGTGGLIAIDNFLGNDPDGSAAFLHRTGSLGPDGDQERIVVPASAGSATLMFQDFAALIDDAGGREASILASERTQRLLDATWQTALDNER